MEQNQENIPPAEPAIRKVILQRKMGIMSRTLLEQYFQGSDTTQHQAVYVNYCRTWHPKIYAIIRQHLDRGGHTDYYDQWYQPTWVPQFGMITSVPLNRESYSAFINTGFSIADTEMQHHTVQHASFPQTMSHQVLETTTLQEEISLVERTPYFLL